MNKNQWAIKLENEQAMVVLGKTLGDILPKSCMLALYGQLGAGKTTLVRSIIQSMGYEGAVKSPTYGLVETYDLNDRTIHHFDLYRLNSKKELEAIGMRDYLHEAICLIEWAEKGANYLPKADLDCYIDISSNGREVKLIANTKVGKQVMMDLKV